MLHDERRRQVLEILGEGPQTRGGLAIRMSMSPQNMVLLTRKMHAAGDIIELCDAATAGIKRCRRDALVYALPGTPVPQRAVPKAARGSGVIAGRITRGRGSVWGAGLV